MGLGLFKADKILKGTATLERCFMKLLSWDMALTPLGVFSLMATCTGTLGFEALKSSGAYVSWAYGGCLLVLALVMILPLWLFCKVSPGQYFKRTGRLFLTALSTCSSAATLPETMRTCREELGASERAVPAARRAERDLRGEAPRLDRPAPARARRRPRRREPHRSHRRRKARADFRQR